MDFKVEQVTEETEESVKVCCHDTNAEWVNKVHEAVLGQTVIFGNQEGKMHQIKLSDVYYFEVVDGKSFIYTKREVFTAKEKLYELENISLRSSLFRCSKSMILNADKIDYVQPSISGRFEAVWTGNSNEYRDISGAMYVFCIYRCWKQCCFRLLITGTFGIALQMQ